MNTYDWAMLALIVGIATFSGWRGLLWQIANIGSFVVGGILVFMYGATASQLIGLSPPWNKLVASVMLYAIGVLLVFVAVGVVRRGIASLGLEGADRHLGFVFGAFEGMALAFAFTLALCHVVDRPTAVSQSRAAMVTRVISDHLGASLPHRYASEARILARRLRRIARDAQAEDNSVTGTWSAIVESFNESSAGWWPRNP